MIDLSPAEELRQAVAHIRGKAETASPGPWCAKYAYTAIRHVQRNCDIECDVHADREDCRSFHMHDGPFVAMWHPGVAALVAEWLEHTADNMADENAYVVEKPRVDGTTYSAVELDGYSHTGVASEWSAALDLARAINGSADAH